MATVPFASSPPIFAVLFVNRKSVFNTLFQIDYFAESLNWKMNFAQFEQSSMQFEFDSM